jgi:hypothetical protein
MQRMVKKAERSEIDRYECGSIAGVAKSEPESVTLFGSTASDL